MPISNFPNGFKNGITIRGVPLVVSHPGRVYWVGNSSVLMDGAKAASNANDGSFLAPWSTLTYAIGRTTASRGDVIMIKPGHAETISSSTALSLSKAGVAIVGLGQGSLRPTFTLDTATTATINVTAANVTLKNVIVSANFADIVSAFTLTTAKWFTLEDVAIAATATNMNFLSVIDTNATSNDADGLSVVNCTWIEPDAATLAMVKMDGTNDKVTLSGNFLKTGGPGTSGGGLMRIATTKLVTNALITENNCVFATGDAGTNGVLITTDGSTNSGMISRNFVQHTDTTSEVLVTASSGFSFSQNYASGVVGASGYLLPAADS